MVARVLYLMGSLYAIKSSGYGDQGKGWRLFWWGNFGGMNEA
jgi:hypothetical protein